MKLGIRERIVRDLLLRKSIPYAEMIQDYAKPTGNADLDHCSRDALRKNITRAGRDLAARGYTIALSSPSEGKERILYLAELPGWTQTPGKAGA
jgi:hypothetical protein